MNRTVLDLYNLISVKPAKPTKKVALPSGIKYPDLICGMELEIERVERPYYLGHNDSFWRTETDGSLRNNGIEFISVPSTMGRLVQELGIFFNGNKFDTTYNYSDRTSIHVHVNVQDFTVPQIKALIVLYALFEKLLFKFVGHYRSESLYCVPLTETLLVQNLQRTILTYLDNPRHAWEKYTALNILPIHTQGTVEFRHLHGTKDLKTILDWLELVTSLVELARNTPLQEVYNLLTYGEDVLISKLYMPVVGHTLSQDTDNLDLFRQGLTEVKYLLHKQVLGGMSETIPKDVVHPQLWMDDLVTTPLSPTTF